MIYARSYLTMFFSGTKLPYRVFSNVSNDYLIYSRSVSKELSGKRMVEAHELFNLANLLILKLHHGVISEKTTISVEFSGPSTKILIFGPPDGYCIDRSGALLVWSFSRGTFLNAKVASKISTRWSVIIHSFVRNSHCLFVPPRKSTRASSLLLKMTPQLESVQRLW